MKTKETERNRECLHEAGHSKPKSGEDRGTKMERLPERRRQVIDGKSAVRTQPAHTNTDAATTTTQPLSLRRTRLRRTNSAGQLDRTREREPTTRHRASETTNPKPDHSTEQEHQIWKEES